MSFKLYTFISVLSVIFLLSLMNNAFFILQTGTGPGNGPSSRSGPSRRRRGEESGRRTPADDGRSNIRTLPNTSAGDVGSSVHIMLGFAIHFLLTSYFIHIFLIILQRKCAATNGPHWVWQIISR